MPKALILNDLIPQVANSVNEFEKEIGAGNGSIGKAINRGSELSDAIIRKILKRYPKVSEHYLETGEGDPIVKNGVAQSKDESPVLTQEQSDWKQAHDRLMSSHEALTQSHVMLTKTLDKMADLLGEVRDVKTNLNRAIKDQEGYHSGIVVEHKVLFDALDEVRGKPVGELAKIADNALHERLQKIAEKDNVGF